MKNGVMIINTGRGQLIHTNALVTSHQAFFTQEAMENIAMTTLQNIKDFILQKPLVNEVKK